MAIRMYCFIEKFLIRLFRFLGVQYENSSEVGVFAKLTSKYCITPLGNPQFYSYFEAELADHIPVIQATFAGTKIIGRLCVGM